jgi:hypothetical protein
MCTKAEPNQIAFSDWLIAEFGQKQNTSCRRVRFSGGPSTWYKRRHPGHEIQRLQYDMGRAVAERALVLVDDPSSAIH